MNSLQVTLFKQLLKFSWVVLSVIVFVLFGNKSVMAFTEVPGEPGVCQCNSCVDCSAALNITESECTDGVRLTQNIAYEGEAGEACIDVEYVDMLDSAFDCQGHSITGDTSCYSIGIYLPGVSNFTVQQCYISEFDTGIELAASQNVTILSNSLVSNIWRGLSDGGSVGNTIADNTITNTLSCEGSCDGMRVRGIESIYGSLPKTRPSAVSDIEGIGIYDNNTDGNSILNNSVYNNCEVGYYNNCSGSNVRDNYFCGNGDLDIYAATSCEEKSASVKIGSFRGVSYQSDGGNACIYSSNWADEGVESGCLNDPACYSLSLMKSASAAQVTKGTSVAYTYSLTNTGFLPITNVILSDDKCSPTAFPSSDLSIGETMETTCTVAVNATTTNVATVAGIAVDVQETTYEVTASASATVQTYTTLEPDHIGDDKYDPNDDTYHADVGKAVVIDGVTDPGATVSVEIINGTIQTCTTSAEVTGHFSCTFSAYTQPGTYHVRITASSDDQLPTVLGEFILMVGLARTGTNGEVVVWGASLFLFGYAGVLLRKKRTADL